MTFETTTKKPIGSGSCGGDRMQAVKELKKKQEENKAKKEAKKQSKS